MLIEPKGSRDVTLIGTGSELALGGRRRRRRSKGRGSRAAVVSMPCFELFEAQNESYRNAVLGSAPRVAVEAAVAFGWSKWLGPNGAFIGMRGFGASAPAQDLYKHFGITAEAVAAAARDLIGKTKR